MATSCEAVDKTAVGEASTGRELEWEQDQEQQRGCGGDAAASDEEAPCCFICLDGSREGEPLARPCRCQSRPCHLKCLARWQLQQAGRQEEVRCRFCSQVLPDWRSSLMPQDTSPVAPVMAIKFEGRTYKLRVQPGPDGLHEFQSQVRQLLGFDITDDFDVTFECQLPSTGEKMKLLGLSSYGAATHCAAITAAQRQRDGTDQPHDGQQQAHAAHLGHANAGGAASGPVDFRSLTMAAHPHGASSVPATQPATGPAQGGHQHRHRNLRQGDVRRLRRHSTGGGRGHQQLPFPHHVLLAAHARANRPSAPAVLLPTAAAASTAQHSTNDVRLHMAHHHGHQQQRPTAAGPAAHEIFAGAAEARRSQLLTPMLAEQLLPFHGLGLGLPRHNAHELDFAAGSTHIALVGPAPHAPCGCCGSGSSIQQHDEASSGSRASSTATATATTTTTSFGCLLPQHEHEHGSSAKAPPPHVHPTAEAQLLSAAPTASASMGPSGTAVAAAVQQATGPATAQHRQNHTQTKSPLLTKAAGFARHSVARLVHALSRHK